MNSKLKKLLTSWRVIFQAVFIVISLIAIHPTVSEGIAIRSVISNSSASLAGIQQPKPNIMPVAREKILSINNRPIDSLEDYYKFVESLSPNRTIQITTNKGIYKLATQEVFETVDLNETEEKIVEELIEKTVEINGTSQIAIEIVKKTIIVPKTEKISKGVDLGLRVYEAPTTNIRKGLDLQGGTRVLLQPERKLSQNEMSNLLDTMIQRLNVYGLSDIVVRDAVDLTNNQYIVVEIAGATEEEIRDLLAKQGKFEAKIGNATVFRGGQDITYVGRSAQEARIENGNAGNGEQIGRG